MKDHQEDKADLDCPHPEDNTITYFTNTTSGCGGPPDREITHCYECSKIINIVDISL